MNISINDLYRLQACHDQAALFVKTFGLAGAYDGVPINFANLMTAHDAALDVPWLVGSLHIDMSSLRDENYRGCTCDMCTARHALEDGRSGEVFGLIVAWAREQDELHANKEQPIKTSDFLYDVNDDYVTESEGE